MIGEAPSWQVGVETLLRKSSVSHSSFCEYLGCPLNKQTNKERKKTLQNASAYLLSKTNLSLLQTYTFIVILSVHANEEKENDVVDQIALFTEQNQTTFQAQQSTQYINQNTGVMDI